MYFSKYITQGVFHVQIISSQMTLQCVVRCVIVCRELHCFRQSFIFSLKSLCISCSNHLLSDDSARYSEVCNSLQGTSVFTSKSGFTLCVHPYQQMQYKYNYTTYTITIQIQMQSKYKYNKIHVQCLCQSLVSRFASIFTRNQLHGIAHGCQNETCSSTLWFKGLANVSTNYKKLYMVVKMKRRLCGSVFHLFMKALHTLS